MNVTVAVEKIVSKEALDKFVNEYFLRAGEEQDKLKDTNSFEDFVDLMVRLGSEQDYSFTAEDVRTLVLDEINKQKVNTKMSTEAQDELDKALVNEWKNGRFVEIGISRLRLQLGDDVLPVYP